MKAVRRRAKKIELGDSRSEGQAQSLGYRRVAGRRTNAVLRRQAGNLIFQGINPLYF